MFPTSFLEYSNKLDCIAKKTEHCQVVDLEEKEDYLGGPDMITRVFIKTREKQMGQSQEEIWQCYVLGI